MGKPQDLYPGLHHAFDGRFNPGVIWLISMGIGGFYAITYAFYPYIFVFDQATAFRIFPNLALEQEFLRSIGEDRLADIHWNFQMNICVLYLFLFIVAVLRQLICFRRNGLPPYFYRFSEIPIILMWGLPLFGFSTISYLWGFVLVRHGHTGKWPIDGIHDIIFLPMNMSCLFIILILVFNWSAAAVVLGFSKLFGRSVG